MALANSSLAMAAETISVALEAALQDVKVVVDTPAATQKALTDAPSDKHKLNIFFYRVAPSGFHAAATSDDPLFVRVSALLTPFPSKTVANSETHPALQMLGEVMRYFHENPVGQILPAAGAPAHMRTPYRIEAALQAPTMEELNHIWTTQGEIGYRMSAAYEFALVPIDPLVAATPAGDVLTTIVQVSPSAEPPMDAQDYDITFTSVPAETEDTPWPGPPHLPNLLVMGSDGPAGTTDIDAAATRISFALAGAPGSRARINLSIRDAAGAELRKVTRLFDVKAGLPDGSGPAINVPVNLGGAASVVAQVRQTDAAGVNLVPDRIGNTLTLTVTGGP